MQTLGRHRLAVAGTATIIVAAVPAAAKRCKRSAVIV
jgi:hypothetical protein